MKLQGFCAAKNGKLLEPILDYIASTEELAWEALYLNDHEVPDEGLRFYDEEVFKEVVQKFGASVVPCVLELQETSPYQLHRASPERSEALKQGFSDRMQEYEDAINKLKAYAISRMVQEGSELRDLEFTFENGQLAFLEDRKLAKGVKFKIDFDQKDDDGNPVIRLACELVDLVDKRDKVK